MAITPVSSPNAATGGFGSPIVTAPFSPPADSLLVVCCAMFTEPTISNSGTARTWTLARAHPDVPGVRIYTAQNPTAQSNITISVTPGGGEDSGAIKVYVFTGVKGTGAVGATGAGTSATNAVNVNGYTSTDSDSQGVAVAVDWNGNGTPTSTDTETALIYEPGSVYGMALLKAATTPSAGSTVTFNLDAAGTAAADWAWVAIELLKASQDASITATVVTGTGDIPAPAIRTNSKASPAVVTGVGDVPAPEVHAGQTAQPDPVTGIGDVPAPNVVAGSAELVEPATVEGAGDVPEPTITAVQNATTSPAVVEGVGDVPAPEVTATFQATVTPAVVEGEGSIPSVGVSVPILPGALITQDGQVEWGGTALWGDGTSYALREITGWDAKPQVDSLTTEEPGRHGAYAGRSYLQRRIVTVRLQVQSFQDPTQVSGLLAQLRYDTRTLRDNTLWTLVIRGYTETLMAFGKVIDRTGVMNADWSGGYPEPVITFECPDPRRYSLDQHSVVVPANASGPTALVNDGDLYTSPTLRFAGPVTNPLIYNETLNRALAFDIALSSGETLIVDTQLGKATIAGVDHENDLADTISVPLKEWFCEVGSNDLSYETESGGDAGVEILWRDAQE